MASGEVSVMRINAVSTDEVYATLGTSQDGIDDGEAEARIRQFGYNEICLLYTSPSPRD